MAANNVFTMVNGRGWSRGFTNLLGNELARWWKTRMWWIQCLIWTILTIMYLRPWEGWMNAGTALWRYSDITGLFQAIGVIVVMQGVLLGEKKDGTAAWVLSKPATRPALVLSKLIANSLGVLTTMLLLSGAILCVVWLIRGWGLPKPILFLETLGIIFLSHLWYLTLTLMLGALFNNRMVILGISAGMLALSDSLIVWYPLLRYTLPWYLLVKWGAQVLPVGITALMIGRSIDSYIPTILVVAIECVLFVLIALWRFNREEL